MDVIKLKITLQGTKPSIWRRILVDKQTTFSELHSIIQLVMGWQNCHLYEFKFNRRRIVTSGEDFDLHYGDDESIEASTTTLGSIITVNKINFTYEYDLGNSWLHRIRVEEFLPTDPKINYPVCLDGKLNCPPEDCGGIGGFYDLLDIINNQHHPQRKEILEWLGEYDSEHFDKDRINRALASLANSARNNK